MPGVSGNAVEMGYDFGGVSGYAFVRRKANVTLPRNYEIRFRMRGTGGRNDLQMKLTNGDNVWWKVWRNARPPAQWQEVVVPAGEVGFAWGPTTDKTLRRAAGIEFVVARNRDGGAGTLVIDDLRIVPLPGGRRSRRRPKTSATTPSPRLPRRARAALSRAPLLASSPTGRWPDRTAARSAR